MDLTSPAFPTPDTASAIYHLSEEEIKVLYWRQYRGKKKPINQKSEPHQISEPHQRSQEPFSFEITGWSMRCTRDDNSYIRPESELCGGFPACLQSEPSPTILSHHLTCKRNWCVFIQSYEWWVQDDRVIVLSYDSVIWSLDPWFVLVD